MSDLDFWEEQEMAEQEYDAHQKEIAYAREEGYQQGKSDMINEIHTQLFEEMAILNEHEMNETNLRTFAFRIKQITEQLKQK